MLEANEFGRGILSSSSGSKNYVAKEPVKSDSVCYRFCSGLFVDLLYIPEGRGYVILRNIVKH
jgi:hypothetical protein